MINGSKVPIMTYHFSIGMTDKNPQVKAGLKPKPLVIQSPQVQPVPHDEAGKQHKRYVPHVPAMPGSMLYNFSR